MKKVLSIFAAMLFAGSMMAQVTFKESWFANTGTWNEEKESKVVWNDATKTATVTIAVDKDAQWRAQVKFDTPIPKAGKFYDMTIKMKANKGVNGVTVKYQDNLEMHIKTNVALAANEERVYTVKDMEGADGGNGILVLDFGFAKAGTTIEIYGIEFTEKNERTEPIDPNASPYETWFASTGTWDEETESNLVWDAATKTATVNIANDKDAQWRAQVKYHGRKAQAGHFYDVAFKMKANADITGITVKYQDNAQMLYEDQSISLTKDKEFVYEKKDLAGIAGNGIMVFDFGFAKKGNSIQIYGVSIVEKNYATGIENAENEVNAVKTIENGQLVIIKNGVRYNAAGQAVK